MLEQRGLMGDNAAMEASVPAPPWERLSDTQLTIVATLLRRGRMARADLMEAVGVSAGSITRLTSPLLEAGILTSHSEQVAATGRPQSLLEVRAESESLLGATLSPHSLTVCLTDLRLRARASMQVPLEEHSPQAVVSTLRQAIGEVIAGAQGLAAPVRIGMTLGGTARDRRTVDQASFFGWSEVPLAQMVQGEIGLPCTVGNDVAALAEAEAWFGAGREHERLDVITVGSGIGFALVVGGQVVTSPSAELGLMGSLPVPDGSRPPVASPAMECLSSAALESAWLRRTGQRATALDIAGRAHQGQAEAVEVCSSYARRLGRFIAMAAAFTLPQTVVVMGERADVAALLEDQVMVGIAAVRRPGAEPIELQVRDHRRTDWARGAACLALRERLGITAPQAARAA